MSRTKKDAGSTAVASSPAPGRESKHYTRAHAVCSSSASKMWLNCPPSARLQEQFPNESTTYALEGTFVHELGEYLLKKAHKMRVKRPQSEEYDTELAERNAALYAEVVTECEQRMKEEHGSVLMLIEERLDFSHIVPEGFGSGDCVLLSPGELHIFDYKNGHLLVDADHNSQMMLYGLGALHSYDFIYDVQTVSMTIVQPNVDNISTFTCTKEELLAWGESVKPIAQMAFEGKGEQKAGDWCRFCRAKPICEARKREALALAREEFLDLDTSGALADDTETDATAPYCPDTGTTVFKQPMLVPKEELENILPMLNRIEDWISAVFAYVTSEAINHGVTWKGYKVVEGRSKRQFTDTKAVVDAAAAEGYTDVYKRELLSLTEFEKLMGKKTFARVLGKLVVKPPGKLTLVPDNDPRPAVELNSDAGDDFDVLSEDVPF